MKKDKLIYIVDDDDSVRSSLKMLMDSYDYSTMSFSSADEFLNHDLTTKKATCLVLDVKMPGLSGMDLQKELNKRNIHIPIIFISGHGDIPMSVEAMKRGAATFLTKPFDDDLLLQAIGESLDKDLERKSVETELEEINRKFDDLSPRETEVLRHLIGGKLNKQVASQLKISERTVKAHRKQILTKLQVKSMAELVRLTEKLGIEPQI